jgi:F0F1-type ATP synthase assembly protein I
MAADSREPAFVWDESDDDLSQDEAPESGADAREQGRVRNPAIVAVFGGLYAVWAVAWVLAVASAPAQPASSLLDAIMFQFGEFLAVVVTPLWFGVVWWKTQETRERTRVWLLVLGLVLLVPAPLIIPVLL